MCYVKVPFAFSFVFELLFNSLAQLFKIAGNDKRRSTLEYMI